MSTINVNLNPCTCRSITPYGPAQVGQCTNTCPGAPVLIPCPIQRSVTFDVRLGECVCGAAYNNQRSARAIWGDPMRCLTGCSARPVRVSCSISGKTWADSHPVADWDMKTERAVWQHRPVLWPTVVERWTLVKALVMGKGAKDMWMMVAEPKTPVMVGLVSQRDAVFSALAKAHRAEDALIGALGDYEEAMRGEPVGIYGMKRESYGALARYVEHLIEQVGVLS